MAMIMDRWMVVTARLADALMWRATMRDMRLGQAARDHATIQYTHAVDALVEAMGQMREDGTMASIARILSGRRGVR